MVTGQDSSSRVSVGLVRFWVFLGAAVLAGLLGWGQITTAVDWWNGPPYCGPNCGTFAPLLGPSPGVHVVAAVVLLALGAVFVYLAIRAKRRRATTR